MSNPYEQMEHRQYVNTLVRLIETRRSHEGNDAAQKEVDMVIRRMQASVIGSHGEQVWAAIEGDAHATLSGPRRTESGLYLV